MKILFAFVLSLSAPLVLAQSEDVPGCAEAVQIELPAESQTQPDKDCDSDSLIGEKQYEAARRCAWAERAVGEAEMTMFGGSASLLAIYANGLGVPRDYALARRFACDAGGAYAEVENRLEHLAAMEAGTDQEPLDFCDDITSGYMMGFCAQREAWKARPLREETWKALLAAWPPEHREAWNVLHAAAQAFFEARIAGEVDASGTGRAAFIVAEEEALAIALLESVQRFERGELPQADEAQFAEADRRLNEAYGRARAAAKFEEPGVMFGPLGTTTPEGIRDAERAWIKYRDAWVTFGAVRWPAVSAVAWRHWATVERERQLRELVGE